jgi:MSHA pilin protein MshC|tara:strand:+ start:404 stop:871 length:468 start_codon:yes stop_codon:yes gene_type:complete
VKNNNQGFTLVELVMVITLVAILSAVASGLFLRADRFATLGAREQLISVSLLAQKRALANVVSGSDVVLTINQLADEWQFIVIQGGTSFESRSAPRSGSTLSVNGTTLTNGGSVAINFDNEAETGTNTEFIFSADNSHTLCLSSTGFAYPAACQP